MTQIYGDALEQNKSVQQKGSPTEALFLFQILRVKFYVWYMWYCLATACAGKRKRKLNYSASWSCNVDQLARGQCASPPIDVLVLIMIQGHTQLPCGSAAAHAQSKTLVASPCLSCSARLIQLPAALTLKPEAEAASFYLWALVYKDYQFPTGLSSFPKGKCKDKLANWCKSCHGSWHPINHSVCGAREGGAKKPRKNKIRQTFERAILYQSPTMPTPRHQKYSSRTQS